jgi:hypothetical protein
MKSVLDIVATGLYFILGIICLIMAVKSILSKKYLPFHEEAACKPWESIDKPIQNVIITILRISGLGFFIVFLVLTIFPIINYFRPDPFIKYSIPIISFIFCSGLFLFNYILFKQTKAKTPWIGALIGMFVILISFLFSII